MAVFYQKSPASSRKQPLSGSVASVFYWKRGRSSRKRPLRPERRRLSDGLPVRPGTGAVRCLRRGRCAEAMTAQLGRSAQCASISVATSSLLRDAG